MADWVEGIPDKLQPGMILEFKDGEQALVGDLNTRYGTCNCCDIPQSDVARYKINN